MAIQERPSDPHVRIVVIDDDKEILKLMTDVLSENEIDVVTESDSQKGLALALEPGVDIVVSDIMMPNCSGLEILERIMKVNPTINVILLTGDYSTEAAVSAIGLGASDYINKTIAVSELRQ